MAGTFWLLVGPQMMQCFCDSKTDIAKAGAMKLAHSSYPIWSERYPAPACPTVDQLAALGGAVKDPWGKKYQVRCDPDVGGLVVWSTGPDRRDDGGGGDDIGSW